MSRLTYVDAARLSREQKELYDSIAAGPRVGIDYAEAWVDRPWRFWLRDNPFVSRSRAGVTRGGGARSGGVPT